VEVFAAGAAAEVAAGAGAGAGVAAGLLAGALAGAALVAGVAVVVSADFFDELFLAGAVSALAAAGAGAAVSAAPADFLDLLFLVVAAVSLSAAALSVAVLLFFEVLFLVVVESSAAALFAEDFFLALDLAVFVESALASALLWAGSATVAFLAFFLVVVVGSPVSEVLDCWALLTLPQTNSSAAITARNNPLLNFIEFSPSAYGCLEDLTYSFASCRGGLDRL
jgi:hypothetical protein